MWNCSIACQNVRKHSRAIWWTWRLPTMSEQSSHCMMLLLSAMPRRKHWTKKSTAKNSSVLPSRSSLVCSRYTYILLHFCVSLHYNSHFPGGPGLAGTRMSPFWIMLELRMMEVVVTTGAMTYKVPVKSSPPTNQHPAFYRPDALPITQPTVSKHWRRKYDIPQICSPQTHLGVFHPCLPSLKAPGYLGEGCQACHQPSDPSTLFIRSFLHALYFTCCSAVLCS